MANQGAMPAPTTKQEAADAIRQASAALNRSISHAAELGLIVDLELRTSPVRRIGAPEYPVTSVTVLDRI